MVVCHSESSLVKGVESSSDNGESDCDTLGPENNEQVSTKRSIFNNLAPEASNDAVAKFENISVCNSTDIHFGNKTFYNGPVTIKQFVYSPEENTDCVVSSNKEGNHNISHIFRKLSGSEIPDATHGNLSGPFAQIDVKAPNVGQILNCSSYTTQENSKSNKGFHTRCLSCTGSPLRYAITAAAVLLVTVLLVALTVLVVKNENKTTNSVFMPVPSETVSGQPAEANFTLSGKLRIMQRREWLAQPTAPLPKLTTPVPYVIISHTATEECVAIAQCVLLVRTVQTFHIESRGWWDIGYNFLVGGDGFAYVGRGWDSVGAHAYGYNNVSIGISFMGTFNNVRPPDRQLTAAKQLIELGVQSGKIAENYKLLAHRQVSATESPGTVLYQELQTWPHWAPRP